MKDRQKQLLFISASVALLVAVAFSDSAFRMDDPLFIWTAKQITREPLDPFGFVVNWYGTAQGMAQVTQNPPLTSYYIAFVSLFVGWAERALHAAFVVPALLCLAAVYGLARLSGSNGGLASLFVAASPAFQLSALTVMSDMWLTAFWCLACLFWARGFKEGRWRLLALGAFFSGLAALTKYFGLATVPLLAAYGFAAGGGRRPLWLLWLSAPLAMLLSWHLFSLHSYGQSHVLQAAAYSSGWFSPERLFSGTVSGLAFLGGCSVFPLVLFKKVGRRGAAAALAGFAAIVAVGLLKPAPWGEMGRALRTGEALLLGATGVTGALALWAAASLLGRSRGGGFGGGGFRDPDSLMLLLWIAGTLAFAAYLNWTLAGRNMLVLVPAVAVVTAKVMENLSKKKSTDRAFAAAIAAGLLVSLAAASADSAMADASRRAADEIAAKYSDGKRKILFQGHWGFQYYMEGKGASHLDFQRPGELKMGDVLVNPAANTNVRPLRGLVVLEVFRYRPNRFFSTMNREAAAGYYSSLSGPMPFGLGDPGTDDYRVYGFPPRKAGF